MISVSDSERLLKRSTALLLNAPEIFMSGFLWQGLGVASGYETTSTSYFFVTGFGAAIGAMVTHILVNTRIVNSQPFVPRRSRNRSVATFFALFLGSGTTWQKIANDTHNYGMNFTQAFFLMWFLSFLQFLAVLTVIRLGIIIVKNALNKEFDLNTSLQRFYHDVQVSFSVGLADAFLLGTSSGFYTDNSLGGLFGITSDTPIFEGMVKSGSATLLGFVVSQVAQNIVLEDCWLDRPPPVLPDNKVPLIL